MRHESSEVPNSPTARLHAAIAARKAADFERVVREYRWPTRTRADAVSELLSAQRHLQLLAADVRRLLAEVDAAGGA